MKSQNANLREKKNKAKYSALDASRRRLREGVTDLQMDKRMDGQTDGWTDRQTD